MKTQMNAYRVFIARHPLAISYLALWCVFSLCAQAFLSTSLAYRLENTLRFGFDAFGRNLLPLILHASGVSLVFAGIAVVSAGAIALAVAGLITLGPRFIQTIARQVLEFLLAFPSLLIALGWSAVRGPGWTTLLGSLLIGTLPHFVRLLMLRGEELLREEFVLSSFAMGASRFAIFKTHLLPHFLVLVRLKLPNLFAGALLSEASLSYLGIGAPIGSDTLGSLLAQGRDYLLEAPHILVFSGLPLILMTLSLLSFSSRDS